MQSQSQSWSYVVYRVAAGLRGVPGGGVVVVGGDLCTGGWGGGGGGGEGE